MHFLSAKMRFFFLVPNLFVSLQTVFLDAVFLIFHV